MSSFGDSRMLVEKFIDNPRHIEIQVLGDKHGNIIHLNERECSIQRRNQKVIEEAPRYQLNMQNGPANYILIVFSVFLDEQVRKAMGNQAVQLCKKLGYSSAGTVEFLVDEDRNFYFLEMNTRLQVEHPITECITGVDLVQQMIRVAKGHELNLRQEDIGIRGWAIESRIYAEDPYKNFGMPSIGRLHKYNEPTELAGVRCDSGIEEGSEISVYYDPMICKLVCYGQNRSEAIKRSVEALDKYVIRGVSHNIPLLRDILMEEKFIKGNISTNYLPQTYPDGFKGLQLTDDDKYKLLAIGCVLYATDELRNRNYTNGPQFKIHARTLDKWNLHIRLGDESYAVGVSQTNGMFLCTVDKKEFKVDKRTINLAAAVLEAQINEDKVFAQLFAKSATGEFQIM